MLYLLPLLQALAYVASIPVSVAFCVSGEGGLRAGAGVGSFNSRAALRRARLDMARYKPAGGKSRAPTRRLIRLLICLRLERVSVKGRLGLSDAAATAVLCGGAAALGAALRGRAKSLEWDVAPAFDGPCIELRGMIRARLGQIIVAGIRSTGGKKHGKAPD